VKRTPVVPILVTAAWGLLACQESSPTSVDGDLIPVGAQTVEIILPWSVFGEDVQTYGGFGSPNDLFSQTVAEDFEGTLDSRALTRFSTFPVAVAVQDSLGENRTDSSLTYLDGYAVARFDTIRSRVDGPVELALNFLQQDWHAPSTTWDFRVDTVQNRDPWPEPGAGPVTPLGSATWDPEAGDSVIFPLDSATLSLFNDTTGVRPSARLDMVTPGALVEILGLDLRINTRPSINQDTVVVLSTFPLAETFVYAPFPEPPEEGIRVGGAPAWRTVLTVDIPTVLNGPESLCELVGCPFTLDPNRLNFASLVLTSQASQPVAFQPTDSILLDVRPVLVPERLPKSPLGPSFLGIAGRAVDPEVFGDDAGTEISIPVTEFVRTLITPAPDSVTPPPPELAILSLLEPFSVGFGAFDGPGTAGEPQLRLVLTAVDTVEVR